MSFIHKDWGSSIDIADVVTNIATEISTYGNWSEIDSGTGWTVLRDSDDTMEIEIKKVSAPGSWHLEIEVGRYNDWDTVGHVWQGTAVTVTSSAVFDNGDAPGAQTGALELSYDNDHFILFYDYRANGANWRRGIVYAGAALPYTSGDICLTVGCTIFDDSACSTTNDVTAPATMPLIYDVSGSATAPPYAVISMNPLGYSPSNYQPRCTIKATKQGFRYVIPICLGSSSSVPTSGENAGIRCRLQNLYLGMQYDDVSHGETLQANDNKVYEYFEQVDTVNKTHICGKILWRIA